MLGLKNLTTSVCPMSMARVVQVACVGQACMAWRDLDGAAKGYCGLAGQPTIAPAIAGMTGAADSSK